MMKITRPLNTKIIALRRVNDSRNIVLLVRFYSEDDSFLLYLFNVLYLFNFMFTANCD